MKKTFKELSIGDVIYYIEPTNMVYYDETDQYGNVQEDGKYLIVNYDNNYRRHGLVIPKKEFSNSTMVIDGKTYFVNHDDYKTIIRMKVLAELKKQEDSIETYKKKVEMRKQELRKKYWEYLNY
jgi:hypothetical protein